MARKVIWTPAASRRLAEILEFLEQRWAHSLTSEFTVTLEDRINQLLEYPDMGIKSEINPAIRRILVTKHNALFYTYDDEYFVILALIDTRTSSYRGPTK